MALRGDGIEKGRQWVRYLSIVAFVFTAIAVFLSTLKGIWPLLLFVPGVAVGWLLAERNALQSRIEQWSTLSEYLDWPKIERDFNQDGPNWSLK
jgi:hypothetical protein